MGYPCSCHFNCDHKVGETTEAGCAVVFLSSGFYCLPIKSNQITTLQPPPPQHTYNLKIGSSSQYSNNKITGKC